MFEVISFFYLDVSLSLSILSPRLHKCYDYRRVCTHRIQFTLKIMVVREMRKWFLMEAQKIPEILLHNAKVVVTPEVKSS